MSKRYEITFVPYANQRPQFQQQQIVLNFSSFTTRPVWYTTRTNAIQFTIPAPTGGGTMNQVDLAAFSNWHAANSSNIFTSNITNRYIYTFDGGANSITDGGFDMYDGGNFISFSTTRGVSNLVFAQNINYGTLTNVPANSYGYFISQANVWPQISLAYTQSGTIQWRISGDVGTDGGGSNINVTGTYTTTNQGRNGSFWANQNYGTTDPSIVMTWFTILQPNLNSVITSSNDNRNIANPPPNVMNQNFTVRGSNFLFGCFLLSSRNTSISRGELIPTNEIQNFLSNYVTNAVINIT